jgi:hypothetical protein
LKLRLPLLLPLLKPLRLLPPLKPLRLLPPPLKPLRLLPRLALPPKTLLPLLLPTPKRSNLLSSDEKANLRVGFFASRTNRRKKAGASRLFFKIGNTLLRNLLELLKQQTQNLAGRSRSIRATFARQHLYGRRSIRPVHVNPVLATSRCRLRITAPEGQL